MVSLCSRCSDSVLPIVALDLDGSLAHYHGPLKELAERYWGKQYPEDLLDWDGSGNYEDYLGLTHDQYRELKLAYRQGGFKRWVPAYEGLEDLREALAAWREEAMVEVWITTTRPWNRLDSTDPDTRWWLDQYFGVYDHLLYDDHKYRRLAEIVDPGRVVGVYEDLPEQVGEAMLLFGQGVVMMANRPHNGIVHPSVPRGNIRQFLTYLERKIDWWWMNHGIS